MNVYKKNIEWLEESLPNPEKCLPKLMEELEELELTNKKIREEDNCLYMTVEGIEYQIESRNREKEVKLLTKEIKTEKENLILVLGMGNRQLIRELSEYTKKGSKLIVYEPNMAMLKYILEHENLSEIFIKGNVILWWGTEEKEINEHLFEIIGMNWVKHIYNMQVITPPSYVVYLPAFKNLMQKVNTKIIQYYKSLGNSLPDVLQGFQQNYQNVRACLETNSIKEITDKYKGYPAIIVASGPSLEKNIQHLKKADGKALIISCDASWDACKMHGVKPDAIATIERLEVTYQCFYEGKKFDDDLVLLAPTLTWPKTFEEFKGKKILVSKNSEGIDGWWNSFFPDVEFINTGMSCANLACMAAGMAGCNPIILIGQDLAYTDNKKHSDITHTKYDGANANPNPEGENIMVEDVHGNMVPTCDVFNLFRYWFEDFAAYNKELELIDATEGGAKIQGSTIMTLEDAIAKYCTKKKEKKLVEHLSDKEVTDKMLYDKCEEINQATNKIIRRLYKIKKMSEEHYETLEKIFDKDLEHMTKTQLIKTVKKMQKGDSILRYVQNQDEIITFFAQFIVQTISHVKEIGNELTGENVRRNLMLQGNLMGALKRGSAMLIKEYELLQTTLKEKQAQTGIADAK